MAEHYEEGQALTREGLFQMLAEEAFRDGVLEDWERKVLQKVARFLRLDGALAKQIARDAKKRFLAGELGEAARLDPRRLYTRVVAMILSDGEVDELERKMLDGLRRLFSIDDAVHAQLLAEAERLGARSSGHPPAPAPPEDDPPVTRPPPAPPGDAEPPEPLRRLHQLRRQAHAELRATWEAARGEASGEYRALWSRVLATAGAPDGAAFERVLRDLELHLADLEEPHPDRAAALELVSLSRLFLAPTDPLGPWAQRPRYLACLRAITNLLMDVEDLGSSAAIDAALEVATLELWLDLLHLVRCGWDEPLPELRHVLELACRVRPELAAVHLGAGVLRRLEAALAPAAQPCRVHLFRAARALCEELDARHPLVGAANALLVGLAPERAMYDPDLETDEAREHPDGPRRRRLEQELQHLELDAFRLAVARQGLAETGSFDALQALQGQAGEAFSGVVLADAVGLERPMIALAAPREGGRPLGPPLEIRLALDGEERAQLGLRRPDGSARWPLALELGPATRERLGRALAASGGALDLVSLDHDLEPRRAWTQGGGLDLSGGLQRARTAVSKKEGAAAAQLLEQLVGETPWLSAAQAGRARLLAQAGDLAGARACLEAAVAAQPRDHWCWCLLGQLAAREGDAAGALARLEVAEALAPRDPRVLDGLADLLARAGDAERGLSCLATLQAVAPGSTSTGKLAEALGKAGVAAEVLGSPAAQPRDVEWLG